MDVGSVKHREVKAMIGDDEDGSGYSGRWKMVDEFLDEWLSEIVFFAGGLFVGWLIWERF